MDEGALAKLLPADAKLEVLHEVLPLMTTVFEGPVWRQEADGGYVNMDGMWMAS